ncbi:MAG: GNAT family N-acetyltransferase [Eubacteriales bacterium]|nr:GNAT family N-acetyltransferase [Eubacteriales bacterium]
MDEREINMEILTERLLVRKLTDSDFTKFERSLNDIQRTCMGSAKKFFEWIIYQYTDMDIINGLISFGVFDRETGELFGTAGVGRHDDLHEPEIFYHLLPQFRGSGYATEAVKAITEWALDNYDIPYLIATAGIDNVKSQKVLERCNYKFICDKTLLVHVEDKKYNFKYYRYYSIK